MVKIARLSVAVLAALSLAGCGILFPSAKDRAAKNTPGFKSGFSDGCASATMQDTNYRHDQSRDEAAYRTDKNYRAGWASGFANCRNRFTHDSNMTPGVGPIPDHSPGQH